MNCDLKSCLFAMFLTILLALSVYLFLYIMMYIYMAYITARYESNDLVLWRDTELQKIDEKYAKMPL